MGGQKPTPAPPGPTASPAPTCATRRRDPRAARGAGRGAPSATCGTDGVCCEGRCDGQCEACGSDGTCAPVTGDPVGVRTPCAGDAGQACTGACDGTVSATCAYPAGEVVCRDAACDAGVATVVAHC